MIRLTVCGPRHTIRPVVVWAIFRECRSAESAWAKRFKRGAGVARVCIGAPPVTNTPRWRCSSTRLVLWWERSGKLLPSSSRSTPFNALGGGGMSSRKASKSRAEPTILPCLREQNPGTRRRTPRYRVAPDAKKAVWSLYLSGKEVRQGFSVQ